MSASQPRKPCVLVVDEEADVRSLLDEVLQTQGFKVLLAAGGREAADLFRCRSGEVDVLLLDVGMTEMDGPQTLAALRRLAPNVPCCFMTGGDAAKVSQAGPGVIRVLAKPFTITEVVDALCAAMRGRQPGGWTA
jgi:DNA-binding response OmpR family regulator